MATGTTTPTATAATGVKVLNSQGTKIYVADGNVDVSDCTKVKTELATAKLVGCPQSISNLSQTRSATEYTCLSSNESTKALGSISRGNVAIEVLYDPEDIAGAKALQDAFKNNTPVYIFVELPNSVGAGKHGTVFYFQGMVSGFDIGIAKDSAVTSTLTVEVASDIYECAAEV